MPKSKDCKLKCRIRLEREPILNDERMINDFLSRKFLRFNICILKEPNKAEGKSRGHVAHKGDSQGVALQQRESLKKGEISKFSTNYMINIQLVKGTPLVFLDFSQNFFGMLQNRIEMQQLKQMQQMQSQQDGHQTAAQSNSTTLSYMHDRQFDLVFIKWKEMWTVNHYRWLRSIWILFGHRGRNATKQDAIASA